MSDWPNGDALHARYRGEVSSLLAGGGGDLPSRHLRSAAEPPPRGLAPGPWCPSAPAGARTAAARLQGESKGASAALLKRSGQGHPRSLTEEPAFPLRSRGWLCVDRSAPAAAPVPRIRHTSPISASHPALATGTDGVAARPPHFNTRRRSRADFQCGGGGASTSEYPQKLFFVIMEYFKILFLKENTFFFFFPFHELTKR